MWNENDAAGSLLMGSTKMRGDVFLAAFDLGLSVSLCGGTRCVIVGAGGDEVASFRYDDIERCGVIQMKMDGGSEEGETLVWCVCVVLKGVGGMEGKEIVVDAGDAEDKAKEFLNLMEERKERMYV